MGHRGAAATGVHAHRRHATHMPSSTQPMLIIRLPQAGADVNYSSWRKNVFKAKRTAHQALSTLLALQTANGKNLRRKRGLQRLDTFGWAFSSFLPA